MRNKERPKNGDYVIIGSSRAGLISCNAGFLTPANMYPTNNTDPKCFG